MKQCERLDYLLSYLAAESGPDLAVDNFSDSEEKRLAYRALVNVRPPVPASPEFIAIQDAYLQHESKNAA